MKLDPRHHGEVLSPGRPSDKLLAALFDGALDAILLCDDSGVFLDANPAACAMVGVPHASLVGRPSDEFVPLAYDLKDVRRRLVEEGMIRVILPLLRPDGSMRILDMSATANILLGVHLCVMRDVTEQQQAEADLRESERRSRRMVESTRAILEASEDAIISWELDGTITSWSVGAQALYGYAAQEVVGHNLRLLIPPHRMAEADALLATMGSGRRTERLETERVTKDGTTLSVNLTLSSMCDANGHVLGGFSVARDLSFRKQAEEDLRSTSEQLRQAQKMEAIGLLAGGVAHDFNNLLSVILSYSSMMMDELEAGAPMRDDLHEVLTAGNRAAELTRQLLAFSRKQVLEPRNLDLNQTLEGMSKMLRRLLGEDIELSLELAHGLEPVCADPGQIEQVVMNLVVNARDAMPRGGRLVIETSSVELAGLAAERLQLDPGRYLALAVADNGCGIDAETQSRIFEPFFTTKDKGKGTGLGLSTVFGIVHQSDGAIEVSSKAGEGTRFTIYLPRAKGTGTSQPPSVLPPATLRGTETVLLVEDEDQLRALAASLLKRNGYHVLEAANGGEAFLVCEKHAGKIDLLLTDVVMPRMSGRELSERLAGMRPDMRVLFMSGYTDDAMVHHGVLGGGIAFLHKPITPEALLRKVRQVLDQPG